MLSSLQPFFILMMTVWTAFSSSAPAILAQMAEKIEQREAFTDDNLSTRQ